MREPLQAGDPSTLKLWSDGLGRIQRLLEGLARFEPIQLAENVSQFGLRLHRTRRECDRGLRFGKRLIQMLALHRKLRPRDMVQRRSQRDVEAPVEYEQSSFNHGGRPNVLEGRRDSVPQAQTHSLRALRHSSRNDRTHRPSPAGSN